MVVVGQPDKQKALSLKGMAKITLERLESTDKACYPSNTLTDYYDIIHKLLEAISALEGIKIKGDGAHAELIDHVCRKHTLGEATRIFLQTLRDYRNRISYEGFTIPQEFIIENQERIERIIGRLLKILD